MQRNKELRYLTDEEVDTLIAQIEAERGDEAKPAPTD
jgi:hypothetical protein